ncbi:MAG: type II toxin-antitoxin system RelE/ParE family toxin [Candidatus Aenigmarchaeota archaeon]|nr:type II toxin-antitoxin system RelE/ParE family toxin [Candidatus Aenigmarchaeota archaeon]
MYDVVLHPRAARDLAKLEAVVREQIRKRLRGLKDSPRAGERLTGVRFLRLRIGDYRAIYEVWEQDRKVVELFIGHRRKVYDDFSNLL